MPKPKTEPAPPSERVTAVLAWIDAELEAVARLVGDAVSQGRKGRLTRHRERLLELGDAYVETVEQEMPAR